MKKFVLLILSFIALKINAQDIVIQANSMSNNQNLSIKFSSVESYDINVEETRMQFRNNSRSAVEVDLILGNKLHHLQLYKFNMYV